MTLPLSRADAESAIGGCHLTAAQRHALDTDGYLVIEAVLADSDLAAAKEHAEQLLSRAAVASDGSRRATTAPTNPMLSACWMHPSALEAALSVTAASLFVDGIMIRDPLPGAGEQGLHPDYGEVPIPGMHATLLLDDFTDTNGATRVLPGSHRSLQHPPSAFALERTPDDVVIEAKAGSLLLRHLYLWHAGSRNDTTNPRRVAWALLKEVGHT